MKNFEIQRFIDGTAALNAGDYEDTHQSAHIIMFQHDTYTPMQNETGNIRRNKIASAAGIAIGSLMTFIALLL